ncbi:MAG: hypothetical protein JO019_03055 [Candidatus Kaiserbacteria bacterium]|nr:hypothetical protein [Candidatus Kaiserbacteria bacterium]
MGDAKIIGPETFARARDHQRLTAGNRSHLPGGGGQAVGSYGSKAEEIAPVKQGKPAVSATTTTLPVPFAGPTENCASSAPDDVATAIANIERALMGLDDHAAQIQHDHGRGYLPLQGVRERTAVIRKAIVTISKAHTAASD